jgi:hypothetical protein
MKKTLLSVSVILGLGAASVAQTYTPMASQGLPDGTVGTAYSQDIAISNGASTSTVSLADLGLPAAVIGLIPGGTPTSFSFDVTSVSYVAEALAGGLVSSTANVVAGGSGTVSITGTPTTAGTYAVTISSLTSGAADITALISALDGLPFGAGTIALSAAGITNPYTVPQPIPGLFDEEMYAMSVEDPNSIEESNEVFSLGLYPNPTEGISTLDVNSTVAGTATVEVYSITGSLVQTSVKPIRVGANRLSLDFTSVPAGIYLVKADINGHQALVRTQKK